MFQNNILGSVKTFALYAENDKQDARFESPGAWEEHIMSGSMFLLAICNEKGICQNIDNNKNRFEINVYDSCYSRYSESFRLQQQDGNYKFMSENGNDIISNKREVFSFNEIDDLYDAENVFILNMSYPDDKSTLYHYSVANEEKNQKDFTPQITTKEFSIPSIRPDFNNKQQMIEKLNSWLLLS